MEPYFSNPSRSGNFAFWNPSGFVGISEPGTTVMDVKKSMVRFPVTFFFADGGMFVVSRVF